MNKLPLLWLSLAFLGGVAAASLIFPDQLHSVILLLVGLCVLGAEMYWARHSHYLERRRQWLPLPVGVLVLVAALGMLRVQTARFTATPADAAWYNGSDEIRLVARVIAPPLPGERFSQVRVQAEQILAAPAVPVQGKILLWLPNSYEVEYGDRLLVSGELQTPEEDDDFSYKEYLARQGIHSLMPFPKTRLLEKNRGNPLLAGLYGLREHAWRTLRQIIPMPESSIFAGILLGIHSDIPDYLYQAYQASGTAHILVISGFNISILAAIFLRFFRRILPYGWDALGALLAICLYTLMVGGQPPVVRAAIMGCLALPAYLFGRRLLGLHTLAFTAALMLLVNPGLISDVSFQLSFLATLGIFCFAEPLQILFQSLADRTMSEEVAERWSAPLMEYLLITLAAQLAALPAIIYHFGYFSVYSLLANLLILPVQPAIMILGGIAMLAGMLWEPLGQGLGWLAWWPARYSDQMAIFLGGLPGALVSVPRQLVWITSAGLLLGLIPAVRYQFSPHPPLEKINREPLKHHL